MAGRPVHTFAVVRREQVTPHMVRVILGDAGPGTGFDTFSPNEYTDAYVKLVIVPNGVDVGALPQPLTLDSFAELPTAHRPTVRTYTV
ncbi:siderophore-interacting protein, partial [Mycolicibacterium brisbanense]